MSFDSNAPRTMPARFNGSCAHCHAAITAGDEIVWSRATGARHPACAAKRRELSASATATEIAVEQTPARVNEQSVDVSSVVERGYPSSSSEPRRCQRCNAIVGTAERGIPVHVNGKPYCQYCYRFVPVDRDFDTRALHAYAASQGLRGWGGQRSNVKPRDRAIADAQAAEQLSESTQRVRFQRADRPRRTATGWGDSRAPERQSARYIEDMSRLEVLDYCD